MKNFLLNRNVLLILWLAVISVSFFWNLKLLQDSTVRLADAEARSLYNKDLLYRRWAAKQGGVYVPPSPDTPSNPYLKIPERDVTTTGGKQLTLINPAYMVRQIHEMANEQSGVISHITSLKPLRPANAADPWEAQVLRKFEGGIKEFSAIDTLNGEQYLRFMGVMLVEKPCLKCHESQGYKEGQVRGGISVSVPLKHFETLQDKRFTNLLGWHGTLGLLGLLGIVLGYRRMEQADLARRKAELSAARYELQHEFIQNLGEGVYGMDRHGNCTFMNEAALTMLGYAEHEVIGRNIHDLIHHHFPDGTPCPFQECEIHNVLNAEKHRKGEAGFFRKNGTIFPVSYVATPIVEELTHEPQLVIGFRDITEQKAAEEQIQNLAFYDPLTQLPNRRLLWDRIKLAIASASRHHQHCALLYIDLDNFKSVNDSYGHDTGDLLLQQVALRLMACTREGDTIARLGGDEFVVLLEDLGADSFVAASHSEAVSKKIISSLNRPFQVNSSEFNCTPSIGITLFDHHNTSIEELFKQADIAMYQAKKAGRNTLRFFDPDMQQAIMSRIAMETDLRNAILELEQMVLFYQAQVDIEGRIVGAEALVRWKHPEHGIVSPAEFIPVAEESGLILPLGHWVIQTACKQLVAWARHPATEQLCLAVNVSPRQFRMPTFAEEVLALVNHFGVNPRKLKLEITEGVLLENINEVIEKLNTLKVKGIDISLDDFGTGYSSLQYLKKLPITQLKIDKSFVQDIAEDRNDRAIVRTIIAMAKALDINVIAEGVETEEQRLILLNKGCTRFQGYLFGKPLPIDQFEDSLPTGKLHSHN